MTAAELIERIRHFDPNTPVGSPDYDYDCLLDIIRVESAWFSVNGRELTLREAAKQKGSKLKLILHTI